MNERPNKNDLIQMVIVDVNSLVDLRGIDKCIAAIEIIKKLNLLKDILSEEDATHEAAIRDLTVKIDKLQEVPDIERAKADPE